MEIAVAGGGLLGRLVAWRALRQGYGVTLFEAGSLRQTPSAAATAAGMISPLSEVVVSERLIYDMGLASMDLWPAWIDELRAATGRELVYEARGSLAVAHAQDLAELHQFRNELEHKLGTAGGFRWLDRAGIEEIEPDLADTFSNGLFLEQEAHLDNRGLLSCLLEEIIRQGGICHEHRPVTVRGNQIVTADAEYSFEWVLDCRGHGAKDVCSDLRGVRGEVLTVECPEISLQRPIRLLHPRYKLYIVPKAQHRYVIGATEIESEDRSPVSVQSMLELASALYTVSPAFAEARIVETDGNLRPSFMDNLPRVDEEAGMIRANGLYRHGYLLAPVVVEHMMNLLQQTEASPFADALSGAMDQVVNA